MAKKYYELKNYTLVRQAWHSHFKNVRAPHLTTIKSTIKRHDNKGSIASLPPLRARPSEKREDAKNELQVMFQDDKNHLEKFLKRRSFSRDDISRDLIYIYNNRVTRHCIMSEGLCEDEGECG